MSVVKQFLCFSGVGAIGTVIHYTVLIGCVQTVAMNPVAATTLGAVAGACTNYLLNYHLTFKSRQRHRETALKFFTVAGFGIVLNTLAMKAALSSMPYLLAQLLATSLVLLWNYVVNRYWTFQVKPV